MRRVLLGLKRFAIIALLSLSLWTASWAQSHVPTVPFVQELGSGLERVEEFRFIREQAQKLGVRVWLSGGLATSYGHYVREEMLRRSSQAKNEALLFNYDLAGIVTLSQDLDIAIEGTAEQAEQLEEILKKAFPHSQGERSAWEVRPLRAARGPKEPLLGNPNFLKQHTDSASTGLIELTPPPPGESRVRDLFHFSEAETPFLTDLAQGTLRYYYSPEHSKTFLASKGRNPEIFSVIRYLTKLYRHNLQPSGEDLKRLEQVVKIFNPAEDLKNPYAFEWFKKNVVKLVRDSRDLEQLWSTLDQLGLRQKLITLGDPKTRDSIAWWMNKKPLPSRPIEKNGAGKNITAGELGLTVVAHTTTDYSAYETIRNSVDGKPNAFVSRQGNIPGEEASQGEGFYTATGRMGMRESGYTIRFEVNPEAREGVDFKLFAPLKKPVPDGAEVVITNRNAIRVLAEPAFTDFNYQQYFLAFYENRSKKLQNEGVFHRMRRHLVGKEIAPADRRWAWQFVRENPAALEAWVTLEESKLDPEIELKWVREVLHENKRYSNKTLLRHWFLQDVSAKWPELMNQLVDQDPLFVADLWKGQKTAGPWAEQFSRMANIRSLFMGYDSFLDRENKTALNIDREFWVRFLTPRKAQEHLNAMVAEKEVQSRALALLLPLADRAPYPERPALFALLAASGSDLKQIFAAQILAELDWNNSALAQQYFPVIEKLAATTTDKKVSEILDKVLANPFWSKHPQGADLIQKRISIAMEEPPHTYEATQSWSPITERNRLILTVFSQPHWRAHPRWRELIRPFVENPDTTLQNRLIDQVLAPANPETEPVLYDWVEYLLARGKSVHGNIASRLFDKPQWRTPSGLALIRKMLEARDPAVKEIMTDALPKFDPRDPKVLEVFRIGWRLEKDLGIRRLFVERMIDQEAWWSVPEVQEFVIKYAKERSGRSTFAFEVLAKIGKYPQAAAFMEQFIAEANELNYLNNLGKSMNHPSWEENPAKARLLALVTAKRPSVKACNEGLLGFLKDLLSR